MTNKNYQVKDIYESVYELSFRISHEMSPNIKVLAFYMEDQEIIPDSVNYKINKCFKNEVILKLLRLIFASLWTLDQKVSKDQR